MYIILCIRNKFDLTIKFCLTFRFLKKIQCVGDKEAYFYPVLWVNEVSGQ